MCGVHIYSGTGGCYIGSRCEWRSVKRRHARIRVWRPALTGLETRQYGSRYEGYMLYYIQCREGNVLCVCENSDLCVRRENGEVLN